MVPGATGFNQRNDKPKRLAHSFPCRAADAHHSQRWMAAMDGWRAAARFLPAIVHALDRFQCICHECARNSSRRLIY